MSKSMEMIYRMSGIGSGVAKTDPTVGRPLQRIAGSWRNRVRPVVDKAMAPFISFHSAKRLQC